MDKLEIREILLEGPATDPAASQEKPQGIVQDKLCDVGLPSVVVGRIAAIDQTGRLLVDFPGNASGNLVAARSLVPLQTADIGREVALNFENEDQTLPIIMGLFQQPGPVSNPALDVKLDDESLILTAKREIVLRCGKASITLTSAGKVLIRGAYLVSRSSGVNRIKGGSVQIN